MGKAQTYIQPHGGKRYILYSSVTSGIGLTEERIDQEEQIAALTSSSKMFLNPLKAPIYYQQNPGRNVSNIIFKQLSQLIYLTSTMICFYQCDFVRLGHK